ncbi:MAG: hypothetical protein CL672_01545 [Balneola sp.]|nr:hypothetical protein [Balneola sp.]
MNKKIILVILLTFACATSTYLLISIPISTSMRITSQKHLDEVIQKGLQKQGIANDHYRVYTAVKDSLFIRKVYQIDTPAGFSKTTLHYELHKLLTEYGIQLPGKVLFPEQDIHLYVTSNGTIYRTLRVRTSPDITSSSDSTRNSLPDSSKL